MAASQPKRSFPMYRVRLLALLASVLLIASFSQAQTATGETLDAQSAAGEPARAGDRSALASPTSRLTITGLWPMAARSGASSCPTDRCGAPARMRIRPSRSAIRSPIEGQALDKGTYGLHMIPGENQWTVIFSKNSTSWGSFTYKQDEDALRVTVKPQAAEVA